MVDLAQKPSKPYEEFPLTPHNSGKWAKKIKGTMYYFGRWEDPDGALREYNAQSEALHAGRQPTTIGPGTATVRDLFNAYLDHQLPRADAGKIDPATYLDSHRCLAHFAKVVGPLRIVSDLAPADFKAARAAYARDLASSTVTRYLSNVKAAFNFGLRNGLIAGEVMYGDGFSKDEARVQRKAAREKSYTVGKKMFSPREVRAIIDHAETPMLAMILLGLNAGFLAVDVANLPIAALDLEDKWLEFPRTKTEVMRAAPLWPETVKALRAAIRMRKKPRNPADAGMIFITKYGNRWLHKKVHRTNGAISKVSRIDAINHAFAELVRKAGVHRRGVNFSALRSTFITVANEIRDENATLLIRGHSFKGMDAFYVKDVIRSRLKKVTDHVRRKLLNSKKVAARSRS